MFILCTQLPKLSTAESENTDNLGAIGYAIPWCSADSLKNKKDENIEFISEFLVVTSKFIILFFCYELFHLLRKYSIHHKTHDWYHTYWALQVTLIIGLGYLTNFVTNNQKNQCAITIFKASLYVDGGLTAFTIVIMIILECFKSHSYFSNPDQLSEAEDSNTNFSQTPHANPEDHKSHSDVLDQHSNNTDKTEEKTLTIKAEIHPDPCSLHASPERPESRSKSHSGVLNIGGDQSLPDLKAQDETLEIIVKQPTEKKTVLDNGQGRPASDHNDDQKQDDSNLLVPPPFSLCCLLCSKLMQRYFCNSSGKEEALLLSTSPKRLRTDWCMIIWTVLANGVSLFVFIGFLSYLTQAIPAVAISYYLSPTSSLIRLGFFELAAVVLVMEIAYLIFLAEKLIWLSYVHWNKSIPEEIKRVDGKEEKVMYIDIYLVNGKDPVLKSLTNSETFSCLCKYFHWLLIFTLFQIITFTCVIYLSLMLLHFILSVIIDQTSDSNHQFRDILAILPTIALNGWLLFKHGNIVPVLKNIISNINKTTIEHSEHSGLGHQLLPHKSNYGSM